MNGSPQNAVRQKATPKISSRRSNACLAARSGSFITSKELASTSEMVVRMCVSTTPAMITEASRQPRGGLAQAQHLEGRPARQGKQERTGGGYQLEGDLISEHRRERGDRQIWQREVERQQ